MTGEDTIVGDESIVIADGVARIATFVDWRDAPYHVVSGQLSNVTATTTADSSDVVLSSADALDVGQGLVIYGAGAVHALSAPNAPTVVPNGVTGATTWRYVVLAQSRDFGYSGPSAVTEITNGNATLSATNYNAVHLPYVSTGVHRYLVYAQRGGTGNFVFCGSVLANATADSSNLTYAPIFRHKANAGASQPVTIPAVAPSVPRPNVLRSRITAINGNTVTLDVPASTSASGLLTRRCNLLGAQAAMRSLGGFSATSGPEIQTGIGQFHFSGNLRIERTIPLYGAGGGRSAAAPTQFVFSDGCCGVIEHMRTADRWCPGARQRLGDRVMELEPDNVNTSVYECTTAGICGTTEPTWNRTLNVATADGTVVWTKRNAPAGNRSIVYGIRSRCESWSLPAEWLALPLDPNQPGIAASDWTPNTSAGINSYVRPTIKNGLTYRCTTAGAKGAVEPTWPLRPGDTVTDGTAVWTAEAIELVWGALWILYARSKFEDVSFADCLGTMFAPVGRSSATMSTNCNNWHLSDFTISSHIMGHGVVPVGSDANTGCASDGEITGASGYGIFDFSFLGNEFRAIYITASGYGAIGNTGNAQYGCHFASSVYLEGAQTFDVRSPARWDVGSSGATPRTAAAAATPFQAENRLYNGYEFRNGNGTYRPYATWGYFDSHEYIGLIKTENELTTTAAALLIRIQLNSAHEKLDWYPNASPGNEMLFEQWFTGKRGPGIGGYRLILTDRNATSFVRQVRANRVGSPWWGQPGDVTLDIDGHSYQLGWTYNQSCGAAPAFVVSTIYYAGDVVSDGTSIQVARRTGKSGSATPSWSGALGATTTSGTVIFENVGPANGNRQAIAHPSPAPGLDLGNSDATLLIQGGALRFLPPNTLTADRVLALSNTGAENGQRLRVVREDASPFTYTVGGFVLAASKIGFVEHQYVAGGWRAVGWG